MRSLANGHFLGQSSSMLMLNSVSLKIPEEPGGHVNHIVGEGSPHLPQPSYFPVPSARNTLSCLHLKVPGGFRVPDQAGDRIILSLNAGNSCPSYVVSMGTAPPKSPRPKVW